MNISRTAITVALAAPAGALLAVIAHGIVHTGPDALDPAAAAIGITTVATGLGAAAFYGAKTAVELRADTVRSRRHRRIYPVMTRIVPDSAKSPLWPGGRAADLEAQQAGGGLGRELTGSDGTMPLRPPAAEGQEMQARAEALAAERDARPAYVDPYLTPAEPAAVDGDGDGDLQAGRVEETRTYADADWEDLYAHTVGALGPDAHRYVSTTTAPPAAP